ncbi:MAG: DNA-processing protein DprA [Myxococcaceae bacterium]
MAGRRGVVTVTGERAALAGLWSVPGIGEQSIAYLRNEVGLEQIAAAPPLQWLSSTRLKRKQKLSLEGPTLVERSEALLESARRTGAKVAFFDDPEFPATLREVRAHPPLLFFQGVGEVPGKRRVAMVGTRHADNNFRGTSEQLAESIALQGIGVISGAAMGIDTECHRGALLAGGETWAVLGSSLDQIDPHPRKVTDYLLTHGGTVWSDYPPGVRAEKSHFVRRNRLIAWMADVTLVTRGGLASGALYTVDKALEWRRPVLAVPGEITVEQAMGTNALIRDGWARPCLAARDVLVALGLQAAVLLKHPIKYDPKAPVSKKAQQALFALGKLELDFDLWLERSGLGASALMSCFVELELSGRVVECPGKTYVARV